MKSQARQAQRAFSDNGLIQQVSLFFNRKGFRRS